MDSTVFLYDTTLRDGTQGEGVSFSARDKVLVAQQLDAACFDFIEGGWPGSNPRDMEFFERARDLEWQHARLTAFGSTCRMGVPAAEDTQIQTLLAAETPVVTIFGKTWRLHVTEVLRTTLDENLRMIEESVRVLKAAGRTVIYDAEHFFDGFKDDPAYARATLEAAQRGGADWLVLCDTNGGSQVAWLGETVRDIVAAFDPLPIGIHAHDDCGLGVALSLAAVESGATQVQGTINGVGERIGNANLTTIAPNLHFKLGRRVHCAPHFGQWRSLSHAVDRFANRPPSRQAPFVGDSAFAHKGGVHANAAQKVAESYEHMRPELVGNRQRILLSDMAGGSSVAMKAAELGLEVEPKGPEMKAFLQKLKRLEHDGYAYENADASFTVLLYRHFHGIEDNFALISYRVISEVVRESAENLSEAVVKLRLSTGETEMRVAEATGPVGALDQAARLAFGAHYPALKPVELVDYKVRILQTGLGTDSVVQVLVQSTDGERIWWTCGANPNIIEASWQALRDSYRYALILDDRA